MKKRFNSWNRKLKKKNFHIKPHPPPPKPLFFFFGVCIFEVSSHQKARAGWLIYFLILYNCTRTIISNTIAVGSGHAWDKARVNFPCSCQILFLRMRSKQIRLDWKARRFSESHTCSFAAKERHLDLYTLQEVSWQSSHTIRYILLYEA